jgi:hypothetical protein
MSNELAVEYGFQDQGLAPVDNQALIKVEETRAMHEVQAPFIIAQRFPRDELQAFQRVMNACKRPVLAEKAMYAYPRGNQTVTGPSIRLAEVLLQCWGNCKAGIRELSQSNGISIAEAFCLDLETNIEDTRSFHVPHIRYTKKGITKLTDPRDIYELVANSGARRKRACILANIPTDIVEAAIAACKKTLSSGKKPLLDRIRDMAVKFDELGVSKDMLEKRLGHYLDATIEAEFVNLISIHNSIRDGMSKREDWFDLGMPKEVAKDTVSELIAKKTKHPSKEEIKNLNVNKDTGEILSLSESEKIMTSILNAKDLDTLYIAADLIKSLPADTHDELNALYHKRKAELEGTK